jgi:hypothetical protein
MQWTIKRDWISVVAAVRFLCEVDDNVQVAMTNEEQKEAGTEAFPSLSLVLFFSLFSYIKSFHQCMCVWKCISACPHVQWKFFTNHNDFSSITMRLSTYLCARVLFLVEHQSNVRRRRRRREKKIERIGWMQYLLTK